MASRNDILAQFRQKPDVTVLIIGAGINGAGVFRELALQGVDALLIDKSDYCAGTSAASGRVIHGGIRYLENGEFRLVKEALLERTRLLANAPHYVKPLPATIPVFGWLDGALHAARQFFGLKSKPGNRGAIIIKTGLVLYDLFAGKQNTMPHHVMESRHAAMTRRPPLNPAIAATATYYDARLNYAERLCLEVIIDGEAAHTAAHALNYVSVASAKDDTVMLHDEISGESFAVKPKYVVNASGAWIDFTNRAIKRESHFIGGTKGSHLVVDHPELYALCQGQMFHFVTNDGRLTIFYPLGDKVLIGTTDIPVVDPETAVCDEDETDYLLNTVKRVFPNIQLNRSQIVFRFSGVRPLPASNALTPGQISRDHSAPMIPAGNGLDFPVYSLVGGKWTTFRAFSEQVADTLLQQIGTQRKVDTKNLPVGGGKNYPPSDSEQQTWLTRLQQKSGLDHRHLTDLFERYGTRAADIAEFIQSGQDTPLQHQPAYSRREIAFIALNEQVMHLDDVILRRTMIGMYGELTGALLDELAEVIGSALNWSDDRQKSEIQRTGQIFQQRHGVTLRRSPAPVSPA